MLPRRWVIFAKDQHRNTTDNLAPPSNPYAAPLPSAPRNTEGRTHTLDQLKGRLPQTRKGLHHLRTTLFDSPTSDPVTIGATMGAPGGLTPTAPRGYIRGGGGGDHLDVRLLVFFFPGFVLLFLGFATRVVAAPPSPPSLSPPSPAPSPPSLSPPRLLHLRCRRRLLLFLRLLPLLRFPDLQVLGLLLQDGEHRQVLHRRRYPPRYVRLVRPERPLRLLHCLPMTSSVLASTSPASVPL